MFGGSSKRVVIPYIHMTGVIKEDHSSKEKGIYFDKFEGPLKRAFEAADKEGCVAIVINSPGGSPGQSEMLGTEIRRLSEKYEVPALAFVEDAAASGGYWVACAADEIYALNTSIVGSIGVIGGMLNFHDFLKDHGVKFVELKAGENKSLLSPFAEAKEEAVRKLQSQLLEPTHEAFKGWVTSRRGDKLPADKSEIFSARVWIGQSAFAENTGLIDGIGSMQSVLREKFGEDVVFKDFSPKEKRSGLRSLLGFESRAEVQERMVGEAVDRLAARIGLPEHGYSVSLR